MFVSIASTHRPATDLGFLLHKNPARLHEMPLSFGRAVMAYPRADEERCEFALALDIDPVALVRDKRATAIAQYINDRPYAASSFLSVALSKALGTAMNGRSKERPDLADTPLPLEATVAPVPLRGDEAGVRALFEPLGWTVEVEADDDDARFGTLRLKGTQRLSELLQHLYVLIPALDRDKHYWVGPDEVDKLVAKGGAWLADHPERASIARSYLKKRRGYVNEALRQLDELRPEEPEAFEVDVEIDDEAAVPPPREVALEKPLSLNDRRHEAVVEALHDLGASRVADLGCSEGKLTVRLAREKGIAGVIAIDASSVALERAERRIERLPETLRTKVTLAHGALGYRDRRLDGVDAACLIEVVEHLDPERLDLAMDALFASRPRAVIVTTPNVEHNAVFAMPEGQLRHPDHRFEWTRAEFAAWAAGVAERHGYAIEHRPIGDVHEPYGPPTQMAVLTLGSDGAASGAGEAADG